MSKLADPLPSAPDAGVGAPTSAGPSSVQAVEVAFAVLQALADSPEPAGVSELARRLGQTKARVYRHLTTLRELGFVEKDGATDDYRLGWKIYRLGMAVADNFGLRKLAHRHLIRLHNQNGQTVVLAMPAGADITVLDSIESTAYIAITVRPGSIMPAASSALGRVILAFQPEASLALPITPLTKDTPLDPLQIERRLEFVRERWYEVASNQRIPGVAALAAPVFDDCNRIAGSVALIGSHTVITDPPSETLLQQVQQAAADISSELRSTAWQGDRHTLVESLRQAREQSDGRTARQRKISSFP
ncbi:MULTISPECIES: IclR family transcriptional regulator [unclassified Variovorax]|jgi:IclR family transcriptional regulator, KDG regulon repressor|uniref:IclR family transcriptional regulator n=1 Tax=unclassified Variovorax TaxID=663243 RepID=UPI000A64FC42|nr:MULTISPECIES: IclR family transcriptional regulator [unclassified Variovorax]MBN8758505.1 IclR family transcriptional regulator [Variovorax sp.]